MKLETGKSYHLVYPKAPYPYVAKLVSVDIGTDETDDVILEFLLDGEREVPIKLAQIKSGEVSIEPKDALERTKTLSADSWQRDKELKEMLVSGRQKAAMAARTKTIIADSNVRLPKGKPQDQESEQANPHINE